MSTAPDPTPPDPTRSDAPQFCTFVVGGLLLGVPVGRVQEVVRYQPITPVPLSPRAVRGLINLRGQIVPVIDLRRLLCLPDFHADDPPTNVVVRTAAGVVSLLADAAGDVMTVAVAPEPPPDTLGGIARDLTAAVYPLPGRLMLALDTDRAARPVTGPAA